MIMLLMMILVYSLLFLFLLNETVSYSIEFIVYILYFEVQKYWNKLDVCHINFDDYFYRCCFYTLFCI